MGSNSSKEEEVIISQAGNSGGATSNVEKPVVPTHLEITGIAAACILLCIAAYWVYKKFRRSIEKSVQNSIRQAEQVANRGTVQLDSVV